MPQPRDEREAAPSGEIKVGQRVRVAGAGLEGWDDASGGRASVTGTVHALNTERALVTVALDAAWGGLRVIVDRSRVSPIEEHGRGDGTTAAELARLRFVAWLIRTGRLKP